jgi:hypothetical protein
VNKDQLARLKRHYKVQQVVTAYADAVAAVPAFAALTGQFRQKLALLDGTGTRNPVTSEGATQEKDTVGTGLVARLVKAANALYLLYKADGNLEEAAKMHRRPSDYHHLNEVVLATEATDLSQRVTTNQAALKDYNITTADVTALTAAAASFTDLLTAPQLAIDGSKIRGATAKNTLSDLNRFLKDDLRSGMELLKDSHPEAYKALREACQVDDPRRGKKGGKRQRPAPEAGDTTADALTASTAWNFTAGPTGMPDPALAPAAASDITMTGPDTAPVKVSLTKESKGTVIITHAPGGGAAVPIRPNDEFVGVGSVPGRHRFTFSFTQRPWAASIEVLVAGQKVRKEMSSATLQLPDGEVDGRDKWVVEVKVSTN